MFQTEDGEGRVCEVDPSTAGTGQDGPALDRRRLGHQGPDRGGESHLPRGTVSLASELNNNNNNSKSISMAPWLQVTMFRGAVTKQIC